MKLRLIHIISVVFGIILVTMACGLPKFDLFGIGKDNNSDANLPAGLSDDKRLGEIYQSFEGGYFFQRVTDYSIEELYGIVSMEAPRADPTSGPVITLIGGLNEESKTAEQMLEDFKGAIIDNVKFSKEKRVKVGDKQGLSVEFEGKIEDKDIAGQAVMVAVTPTQMFSMVGIFPASEYGRNEKSLLQALLETVQFFDLRAGSEPTNGASIPVGEPIRQWSSTAKASSEYDNPKWAAHQATGAPDTLKCGDYETAWASAEKYEIAWLEVGFENPVIPTEINIYETHTPTQIVKVEVLDDQGNYHKVYTGVPHATMCPYILNILVKDSQYVAVAVKITVDQSQLELPWDEIDAVELIGYSPAAVARQPTHEEKIETTESQSGTSPGLATWIWVNYTSVDGLPDDDVQALALDTDGTVWIGMKQGGVSSFKDGNFTNFTTEDGLGSNNVKAIQITPDGKVWAGTAAGLSVYDRNTWLNYTTKDGLVNNIVNALAVTSEGHLWIATESGISYFNYTSWKNYTPDDGPGRTNVKGVAIARNGDIWFATFNGVSRFDGSSWHYYKVEDGLSHDVLTSVGADPDGSIWVGTSGKAADRFDGSRWVSYLDAMGPTVYVRTIVSDSDGAMWFGTEGDGIYRYDGQTWLHFLKDNSNLPYNWVDAAAVAPDGAMWFATRKNGIARFGQ